MLVQPIRIHRCNVESRSDPFDFDQEMAGNQRSTGPGIDVIVANLLDKEVEETPVFDLK